MKLNFNLVVCNIHLRTSFVMSQDQIDLNTLTVPQLKTILKIRGPSVGVSRLNRSQVIDELHKLGPVTQHDLDEGRRWSATWEKPKRTTRVVPPPVTPILPVGPTPEQLSIEASMTVAQLKHILVNRGFRGSSRFNRGQTIAKIRELGPITREESDERLGSWSAHPSQSIPRSNGDPVAGNPSSQL